MEKAIPTLDVTIPFLMRGKKRGYSMQQRLISRSDGDQISQELEEEGFLEDLVELEETAMFYTQEMQYASQLHSVLNSAICRLEGKNRNHIPLFSVRVFDAGVIGTTIHRNDPVVGPWAVGVTLRGAAPFNVYRQHQLPDKAGYTIDLLDDGNDPTPFASMNACAGSGWTLYTRNQFVPHSSGMVTSLDQRELLIFYATNNWDISE